MVEIFFIGGIKPNRIMLIFKDEILKSNMRFQVLMKSYPSLMITKKMFRLMKKKRRISQKNSKEKNHLYKISISDILIILEQVKF